jgi:hypothetical protein
MVIWHIVFGMFCGALGFFVSMGMDGAVAQAIFSYSLMGSLGFLASAVCVGLWPKRVALVPGLPQGD